MRLYNSPADKSNKNSTRLKNSWITWNQENRADSNYIEQFGKHTTRNNIHAPVITTENTLIYDSARRWRSLRSFSCEATCLPPILILIENDVALIFDEEALSKTAMKRTERVLSLFMRIIRMNVVEVSHR